MDIRHAFRWASDLAKFYQDWGPDLCESRRRAHSLIGVSFECPYQHPPWSPVSIGKPAPKIHQWTIYFCRWGFGWVDKAQCFRSARRFGAAGSSRARTSPGVFHDMALLGLCLRLDNSLHQLSDISCCLWHHDSISLFMSCFIWKNHFFFFFFLLKSRLQSHFVVVNCGVFWWWDQHTLPTWGLGFAMCLVHQVLPTARGVPGWSPIQVLTPLDGAWLRWSDGNRYVTAAWP